MIATNALDLVIGGQDNDKGPFKGSIDDVRLYDFALTDEEVGLVMAGLPLIVDADGDGFADELDAFPADPTEWGDTDGDGNGDNADPDDDDDGIYQENHKRKDKNKSKSLELTPSALLSPRRNCGSWSSGQHQQTSTMLIWLPSISMRAIPLSERSTSTPRR